MICRHVHAHLLLFEFGIIWPQNDIIRINGFESSSKTPAKFVDHYQNKNLAIRIKAGHTLTSTKIDVIHKTVHNNTLLHATVTLWHSSSSVLLSFFW